MKRRKDTSCSRCGYADCQCSKDSRRYLRLRDGRPTQNLRWGVVYAEELNLLRSAGSDGGVYCLWSWLCALLSNRRAVRIPTTYLAAVTGYSEASVRRFGVQLEELGLVTRSRSKGKPYEWALGWPVALREKALDPEPELELSEAAELEELIRKEEEGRDIHREQKVAARTGERTPEHGCAHISKDSKDLFNPPLDPPMGESIDRKLIEVSESEVLIMLEVLVAAGPEPGANYDYDLESWDKFVVELAQSDTARPADRRKLAGRLGLHALDRCSTMRLHEAVILEASRRALELYLNPPA